MTAKSIGVLFDINQYVNYNLDDDIKKKICFSETLLVSCLHNKVIRPPKNINLHKSISNVKSEECKNDSREDEQEIKTPSTVSDDDFFFYFYDKKLPEKDRTPNDTLMTVNGLPKLNPNRTKVRCICLPKDQWTAVCLCGTGKRDDSVQGETSSLSMTSESSLSEDDISKICHSPINKICICLSNDDIQDACKCGSELERLKCKPLPKVEPMTSPASATSCAGSTVVSTKSVTTASGQDILSLTSESSLSIVSHSEENLEASELTLTTESSLSVETTEQSAITLTTNSAISSTSSESEKQDFGECLSTFLSPDNCTATGGMTISVETVGIHNDKFLIHMSSQYTLNTYDNGSDLLSTIDLNLHTIEENRSEHFENEEEFTEKQYYLAICEGGYYCSTSHNEGTFKGADSKYLTYDDAYNFVLEGANIVLLRYLALRQFQGRFRTTNMKINGKMAESIYITKVVQNAVVNNVVMPVLKVVRINTDDEGFQTSECYVFTLMGYMIQHQWSDNNLVVHINPLLPVDPLSGQISRQIPLRNNWRQDMEMLSKFFDFKDRRLMENEAYLAGKVELQSVLTDYFQAILLMKPREVLPFTRSFFSTFVKSVHLPHNNYFDKHLHRVRYSYF